MDYTIRGIFQTRILEPFPSPGDLPNPGIEPRSPALMVDSLPAEPQANLPKVTSFINLTLILNFIESHEN